MSTDNIGFYEDLTKIVFQLSSNIIKYAPNLFFWHILQLRPISAFSFAQSDQARVFLFFVLQIFFATS